MAVTYLRKASPLANQAPITMLRSLILFFCLPLLVCSCSPKVYQAPDFPDQQIQFGSAGGFTGEVKTYHLLPNGQLFSHSSLDNTYRELGTLEREKTTALFRQAKDLTWSTASTQTASNMNFFLSLRTDASNIQSVEWASEGAQDYQQFYRLLISEVQKRMQPVR